MKQHLLRVERPVVEFAGLIAAMRQAGELAGWLERPREAAGPLPPNQPEIVPPDDELDF